MESEEGGQDGGVVGGWAVEATTCRFPRSDADGGVAGCLCAGR